ncbi:hypothetical protein FB45DRAFT_1052490 [Roridomyces roridus]|uniref:Uncharacterized protein n=1 Tax=Roridomyces roridus TaxID=1738132 RepID=A0AAD7C9X0_9AGAR|nr:hypothetical protein FB45DRAFT_1052490 [Roridomyces roridus]
MAPPLCSTKSSPADSRCRGRAGYLSSLFLHSPSPLSLVSTTDGVAFLGLPVLEHRIRLLTNSVKVPVGVSLWCDLPLPGYCPFPLIGFIFEVSLLPVLRMLQACKTFTKELGDYVQAQDGSEPARA